MTGQAPEPAWRGFPRDLLPGFCFLAFSVAAIAGSFQNVYTCFSEGRWRLLIGGGLFFPLGALHGWGVWTGLWP